MQILLREAPWSWPKNADWAPWVVSAGYLRCLCSLEVPPACPCTPLLHFSCPCRFPFGFIGFFCLPVAVLLRGRSRRPPLPPCLHLQHSESPGASPAGFSWRQEWSRTEQTRGLARGGNGEGRARGDRSKSQLLGDGGRRERGRREGKASQGTKHGRRRQGRGGKEEEGSPREQGDETGRHREIQGRGGERGTGEGLKCVGFRVQGLEIRVQGFGFGV